jgi:hypothetical protein
MGDEFDQNNTIFGLPHPIFTKNHHFLHLHDPPKLQKPSYGTFLRFLRFKNPIFPILIEVDIFIYKISYQKVPLEEVPRFYYLSSFFNIFLSSLKDIKV